MEGDLISKLALLLAVCVAGAAGQPLGCTEDYQCGVGYCDKEALICRECIKCEDFKRSPPRTLTECVTSVVECGACFEGLVENVQGDLHEQCAPDGAVSSAYVWVAIGLGGLLLFVVAVAVVVYMLRHTDTFRILASTRTSVQSGCPNGAAASAPELPPPYNTLYSPVRPDSPAAPPLPVIDEEAASPFIKRPPPPVPERETAGNQAANIFNNPNYVRGPHLPSNRRPPKREPEPEELHDDATVESEWTPADAANNNATPTSSESSSTEASTAPAAPGLSAQLAAARATTLLRPPCQDAATPNKQPRLRQDTNNNRNNRDADEETMPRPAAGGPTFNIMVNVQQLNDVKL